MATAVRRGTGIQPSSKAVPTTAWNSPIDRNNPIFTQSGNDERGRVQNRIVDEQSRYRGQMDPYMGQLSGAFTDALGQGQKDYGNIMGQLGSAASGANPIQARTINYTDPFASYGQFQNMANTGGYDLPNNQAYQGYSDFAKTGGFSEQDMADLRARGMAPVRAAYAGAQREVGRQRGLQGGYSPNATAVQAKMAREQSQGMSDAIQNTNASIIDARNRGKISGLGGMANIDASQAGNKLTALSGMSGIEKSRLDAELSRNKFNAESGMQADQWNTGNKLDALSKMGSLYGTTPGMAQLFGNQLGNAIGDSGQQGSSYINAEGQAQQLPGRYENTKGYVNDAATIANPYLNLAEDYIKNRRKSPQIYDYSDQSYGA